MRILCVAAAYPPHGKGGGPKASETIAKALGSRGNAVRVITVADNESLELRDGIEVKTLRSLNLYWNYWIKNRSAGAKLLWHAIENFNPRALLRMRREIADFRPDIVVTISVENINVATWVAAWWQGCPRVHVIQSYFLTCWRGTMFSKAKNCERPCLQCRTTSIGKKICSQVVNAVIAEASHTLSLHREQGFFRRAITRVIPGAVLAPAHAPGFRASGSGAVRVGYLGMLTPNKGVSTLAEAAALLGSDASFEYLIAGDGDPGFVRQTLAKFPASRTTFLGWVDPNSFYPSIDVLIVPSIWAEPFGYVCIEALSFGIPVIVARSGALPEIIEHEKSGLVFTAADHQELAACLRKIASDRSLLGRLHRGALARAKRYAPETLAASLDAFLGEVCASAKAAS
jgi:glycosyltransferase involved in cell wall biosynthesis